MTNELIKWMSNSFLNYVERSGAYTETETEMGS